MDENNQEDDKVTTGRSIDQSELIAMRNKNVRNTHFFFEELLLAY